MNIWQVKIWDTSVVVEQAKFEYCPLGKVFTKGLDKEEEKKKGFLRD